MSERKYGYALGGVLCPAPYFGNASGVAAVDGNILPSVRNAKTSKSVNDEMPYQPRVGGDE